MPTVQFIGSSRQDPDNIAASPARLVNLYREPAGERRFVLKAVPGMSLFAETAAVGRAIKEVNGSAYVVAGGALHSVDMNGSASSLGVVADDVETTMSGYQENVMLTAGGAYQVYDGMSISTIAGGAFTQVGSVAYIGGWTILTEDGGSRFEWTELQDPKTRNALHVATAEARDDNLLRAIVYGGNLYLMGERSIEFWYQTGLAGANAFARLTGGVIDRGLKARNLVVQFDDGVFFIGNDGTAYLLSERPVPVSSASVETSLKESQATHCFYYEDEGRKFCVIRFADRPSWVYDLAIGEWHERAEGNTLEAWSAYDAAKVYDRWLSIDTFGRVAELGDANTDFEQTLLRKAVSMVFETDEERFVVHHLVARCRTGWAADGANIILRTSKDGGITWSPPKSRSLGQQGQYRARPVWRNLGQFRTFTAELTIADNTDAPIYTDWSIRL